jgi:transcriptional regulator with XRE-family HTH domain
MSKKQSHWTENDARDFLYRIASDFVEQIQERMLELNWNQVKLAKATGLDKSRISQLMNNPGNLGLESIIKLARAVGLKVAVVSYNDDDASNERGPINAEIFRMCWERVGRPRDLWDYRETTESSIGVASYRSARTRSNPVKRRSA